MEGVPEMQSWASWVADRRTDRRGSGARPWARVLAGSLFAALLLIIVSVDTARAEWRPWKYKDGSANNEQWYTHSGSTSIRGGKTTLICGACYAHIATYKASTGAVQQSAKGYSGYVEMWHSVWSGMKSKCKWSFTPPGGGTQHIYCYYFPP
jgi:hypothetical protein